MKRIYKNTKDRYNNIKITIFLDTEEKRILLERLNPKLKVKTVGTGYREYYLEHEFYKKIKTSPTRGNEFKLNQIELAIIDRNSYLDMPDFGNTELFYGYARWSDEQKQQTQGLNDDNIKMLKLGGRITKLNLDAKISLNKIMYGYIRR